MYHQFISALQYTAIDESARLRRLSAHDERSIYSSGDFFEKAVSWYSRRGSRVKRVKTDNGSEFTNRFTVKDRTCWPHLESAADTLNTHNEPIRPYATRHNGKAEHSHREGRKCFCDPRCFFISADFCVQITAHQFRPNSLPMRYLAWLTPLDFLRSFFVFI